MAEQSLVAERQSGLAATKSCLALLKWQLFSAGLEIPEVPFLPDLWQPANKCLRCLFRCDVSIRATHLCSDFSWMDCEHSDTRSSKFLVNGST